MGRLAAIVLETQDNRKFMSYDYGDAKAVKKAKQRSYTLEEKLANGFVKICNDPETRYVLSVFLDFARIFNSTFNQNPTEHAYNEGIRNAGLWFLNNALLNDKDIIAKMRYDTEYEDKADILNDRHDTDTNSE